MFLLYLGLLLFGIVLGLFIGATLVRDALDGIWHMPRPTLPLASVLKRAERDRLLVPAKWRRS